MTWEEELDQESDQDLKTIIELLKSSRLQESEPEALKTMVSRQLWKRRDSLRFRGGLLYMLRMKIIIG